jgi:hypothetical protein
MLSTQSALRKRLARLAGHAILLGVLCGILPVFGGEPDGSIDRRIRYSFTLQNTRGALLEQADFWTYLPLEKTSTQHCTELEVSHPYEIIEDNLGNRILHVCFENLPPYAAKIITVEAHLQMRDVPEALEAEPARHLRNERYLEIESDAFRNRAPVFEGSPGTPMVKRIFDWTRRHLVHTPYDRTDRGALYALTERKGDCTEYACLFAALCRRHGVPARVLGGYVCDRNQVLRPSAYHNWAEFHDAGAWQVADPQRNVFRQQASHYVAVRILGEGNSPMGDFPRFRYQGAGLRVTMNE